VSARAEAVVVADDRTHYLHTTVVPPGPGFAGVVRHHIAVDCTEVTLLRWHSRQYDPYSAVLTVSAGAFETRLNITAEQLRVLAYGMLQCASDLDTAIRIQQPEPGDTRPDLAAVECKPWALPGVPA